MLPAPGAPPSTAPIAPPPEAPLPRRAGKPTSSAHDATMSAGARSSASGVQAAAKRQVPPSVASKTASKSAESALKRRRVDIDVDNLANINSHIPVGLFVRDTHQDAPQQGAGSGSGETKSEATNGSAVKAEPEEDHFSSLMRRLAALPEPPDRAESDEDDEDLHDEDEGKKSDVGSESDSDGELEVSDEESEESQDEDGLVGTAPTKQFWVYVLESQSHPQFSYVGYTVNRERRLRQHNGELASGGAKYTKKSIRGGLSLRPWKMVMSMTVNPRSSPRPSAASNANKPSSTSLTAATKAKVAQNAVKSVDDGKAAAVAADMSWWHKRTALQLEWRVKHVRKGRSRCGPGDATGARGRRPRGAVAGRRWKTLRVVDRPAIERRINDIFWLLHNRQKWTKNSPEWEAGRSLLIEMQPSLITPELKAFAAQCSFWEPVIRPLPDILPKLQSKSGTRKQITSK